MKSNVRILQLLALVAFVLAAGGFLKTAQWREEVWLASGEKILVTRTEVIGAFPFITLAPRKQRQVLQFPGGHPKWANSGELGLRAIEYYEGEPFVALDIQNPDNCYKYPMQEAGFVFYRWSHDGWKSVPFSQYPEGTRPNLRMDAFRRYWDPPLSGLASSHEAYWRDPERDTIAQEMVDSTPIQRCEEK